MSKKKKHRHWFTRDEVSYILGIDRTTLDGWLNKVPKGWFLGPGQRFISFNRVRKQIEDNTPVSQGDEYEASMDRLLTMINRLTK